MWVRGMGRAAGVGYAVDVVYPLEGFGVFLQQYLLRTCFTFCSSRLLSASREARQADLETLD